MKKNEPTLKKQVSLSVSVSMFISLVLIVSFLLLGGYFIFGQERYMLDESESPKFKLAKQLFQKGQQLLLKEKYDNAIKPFKECLEIFPKYAHADYYLAQIYYKNGNFLQALEHIEKAKDNYDYLSKLGVNTHLEYLERLRTQRMELQEKIRDMETQLERIRARNPNPDVPNPEAEELKSQITTAEHSIRMIDDRLRSPVPDQTKMPADYYYHHGNILFKLKRFGDAFDQYLEAVKTDPCHANALTNLANLKFMARKYQDALSYLDKVEKCGSKVNPKFKEAILKAMGK
jgi:tetratricopeptide (TPR) repeat protein